MDGAPTGTSPDDGHDTHFELWSPHIVAMCALTVVALVATYGLWAISHVVVQAFLLNIICLCLAALAALYLWCVILPRRRTRYDRDNHERLP